MVNTPELRGKVYRIRYDVYCREFHYEREEDCPGGMEQDDYDPHSLQVLIAHKTRDAQAGCMRLIPPPAADHNFLLPMERSAIA